MAFAAFDWFEVQRRETLKMPSSSSSAEESSSSESQAATTHKEVVASDKVIKNDSEQKIKDKEKSTESEESEESEEDEKPKKKKGVEEMSIATANEDDNVEENQITWDPSIPKLKQAAYWKFTILAPQILSPSYFVTSYFVSPRVLLGVRFVMWCYSVIVLTASLAYEWQDGWWLAYFTHLTYLSLFIYFSAATLHSAMFVYTGKADSMKMSPLLLGLFWLQYETLVSFHIVVPIVFWGLLSSGIVKSNFNLWLNASQHGLDFVFMATDMILNKIPVAAGHSIFYLGIIILYMFYCWMIHAISIPLSTSPGYTSTHRWVYDFVDWSPSTSASGYYFGLLIFFTLVYFCCFGCHRLKKRIGTKHQRNDLQSKV